MIFYDLLKNLDTIVFNQVLTRYHVDSTEQQEYLLFIQRLLELTPVISTETLYARMDEHDYSIFLESDEGMKSIDWTPFEEAVGYLVDEVSLSLVGKEEFAFHTLYDLSFDGFYPDERDAKIQTIVDRINKNELDLQ